MEIRPTNHTQALRWLLGELHAGNVFTKDTLWQWAQQASVRTDSEELLTVNAQHLRAILQYLHEGEADHYDPENDPEHAVNHIYRHVLAIEAELKEGAQ